MLRADTKQAYDDDKKEVLTYAKYYPETIYAYTVGSETLYRHEQSETTGLTVQELLDDINDFKTAGLPQKVGTADSWNKFQDGTADPLITGGVDFLYENTKDWEICRR